MTTPAKDTLAPKAAADALGPDAGLTPLGPMAIKGHTPVEVFGFDKA